MNRQSLYPEAKVIPNANSFGNNQAQQISAQNVQRNTGFSNFHGRTESFPVEQGKNYIFSSNWDGDALAKVQRTTPMLSHPYSDATQGNNAASFRYQGQILESGVETRNITDEVHRLQSYEQDMDIGYEDKPSPLTLEGLLKKFRDEIVKLLKEQNDVEDAEIARHKEVLMEINNKYQEKLQWLREQEAIQREKNLQKESEARVHQFQLAGIGQSDTRTDPNHLYGYADTISQAQQVNRPDQMKSHFAFEDTSQGTGGRIPYPEERVYNKAGHNY